MISPPAYFSPYNAACSLCTGDALTTSSPIKSCDIDIRVRYAEVDAMGYLHHARFLVYFEMGRTELLRRNGVRYRDLEEAGRFYVVAKLDCRYRAPARYDDELTLTTTTRRLTPVLVEHGYELRRDRQVLAEAGTTLVCVGRDGRPTELPDAVYNILAGLVPRPATG